jgi:hypothetical protein
MNQPREPWKLDTNNKYTEVIKSIFALSTASLLLPVFLARNFLSIDSKVPLIELFSCSIYFAWIAFSISIFSCLFFQYLSAKWIRIAWGKEAGIFCWKNNKESTIELLMEISFAISSIAFCLGIIFTMCFFSTYASGL